MSLVRGKAMVSNLEKNMAAMESEFNVQKNNIDAFHKNILSKILDQTDEMVFKIL